MNSQTIAHAFEMRDAVIRYLRSKYPTGDLSWHPLFVAVRELFVEILSK
jgi:hypothetical protein